LAIYARNSKERGLEVNETVDERYDLVKSTASSRILF
jgi:hypothetical protein